MILFLTVHEPSLNGLLKFINIVIKLRGAILTFSNGFLLKIVTETSESVTVINKIRY
jgi:hypothetical protein